VPRRKRTDRRAAIGDAWREIFELGFDMLHRARWLAGVSVNNRLEPDFDEARAAWQRYGAEFLATYDGTDKPWALATFGTPQ
jgi:hypothetical protein